MMRFHKGLCFLLAGVNAQTGQNSSSFEFNMAKRGRGTPQTPTASGTGGGSSRLKVVCQVADKRKTPFFPLGGLWPIEQDGRGWGAKTIRLVVQPSCCSARIVLNRPA
ncbi:hypothetical protein B0H63DRAFT_57621 [Podospora didyma]|uniref:Secreted protein n=1 Tax=Podospora didyma TaxID=330526 RepID=A0AAE0P7E6_9PEZI|nr:hypothetical protein B0H63DRAFT_57621 [Podospora didyma]